MALSEPKKSVELLMSSGYHHFPHSNGKSSIAGQPPKPEMDGPSTIQTMAPYGSLVRRNSTFLSPKTMRVLQGDLDEDVMWGPPQEMVMISDQYIQITGFKHI